MFEILDQARTMGKLVGGPDLGTKGGKDVKEDRPCAMAVGVAWGGSYL